MDATKVGIRKFRASLAELLETGTPVAVTRHGRTVGYFIPTPVQDDENIAALRKAGEVLDQMLTDKGLDVETLVTDFKHARKDANQRTSRSSKKA